MMTNDALVMMRPSLCFFLPTFMMSGDVGVWFSSHLGLPTRHSLLVQYLQLMYRSFASAPKQVYSARGLQNKLHSPGVLDSNSSPTVKFAHVLLAKEFYT